MTHKSFISLAVALTLPALTVGCGDDAPRPGDSSMGDSSVPVDSGADTSMGDTSMPPVSDGNDSFAEAVEITLNDGMGEMERLQVAGDRDFFRFDLEEGDWLLIDTEANPDDDTDMVDTVVQLFSGPTEAEMVAENDDSQPRVNTDSELIYHVPTTGTYYVRVLEWSDWQSADPLEGDPTFTYTITAGTVDPMAAVVTVDGETGDDAASAQALRTNMDFGIAIGTFDDADDIDVFSFSVPATRTTFSMMPAGTTGYGSTSPIGNIWVTNAAGDEIIARLDNSMGDYADLGPALPAGDYLLHVEHGGADAGANDFFVLKVFEAGTENDAEMAGDNDSLAEADALTQMRDMETMVNQGFVLAQLADGDVDYFSFVVEADEVISLACGSRTSGSGVMGLRAELRNDADDVLDSGMEVPPEGIFIDGSEDTPRGAGTYYLRLSQTGQDPDVTGTYVRCGVRAFVPMAAP